MSNRQIRSAAAVTLRSWVAGSALDAAFLSSVLGAAVRPTDADSVEATKAFFWQDRFAD